MFHIQHGGPMPEQVGCSPELRQVFAEAMPGDYSWRVTGDPRTAVLLTVHGNLTMTPSVRGFTQDQVEQHRGRTIVRYVPIG